MGGIKHIIEGNVNDLLGNNQAIAGPRRKICKACPLYNTSFWGWQECNSKLYLNSKTNDISTTPKPGYYKGCGCRIEAKITVAAEKCPADKW